ncbi:sigma factor [Carnobacterium maltaromaticum]|uniref:sigma factor n=2 Tax=Carnobacterium maltaromaticum TaxID=2751 RepID=UPI0039BE8455
MEIETEKLVRKAKKGNRKALELLLKENYQQMYKTALIYVKNEQDALDVVQETAYKVTMKLDTLKENQYFKTWLIKILIGVHMMC